MTDGQSMSDADMQGCEHCSKEFPIETMTMHEDIWMCAGCDAEWRAVFAACAHDWEPYVDHMGDEANICRRCNGVVPATPAQEPTPP